MGHIMCNVIRMRVVSPCGRISSRFLNTQSTIALKLKLSLFLSTRRNRYKTAMPSIVIRIGILHAYLFFTCVFIHHRTQEEVGQSVSLITTFYN